MKRHQPKHIYVDNQIYFITSRIHNGEFLLDTDSLNKYRYSSYWNYFRLNGNRWLMNVMEAYPVVDFTVENDE